MTISKLTLRGSARLKDTDKCKIVDETSRLRRHRKHMEILNGDNFHEDPHSDLVMSKKIPKFDENLETRTRTKRKERSPEYYQTKFRKHFVQLLEEDRLEAEITGRYSYQDLTAENTEFSIRHFCSVCGFFSQYVCLSCGVRYCSQKCMITHQETRCLKWIS